MTLRYGTIVNPVVRSVNGKVVSYSGDPTNPSTLTLKRLHGIHPGLILSAAPGARFPHGLLAKVVAVTHDHGTLVVSVTPASIYEVAPNMSFRLPIDNGAAVSQALQCGGVSGLTPYVHISHAYATGEWTTTKVLLKKITTGAKLEVHLTVTPGVKVSAAAGLSCALSLPGIDVQGAVGFVPVYGSIKPTVSAEIAAGAKMHAELSSDLTLGAGVSLPASVHPIIDFSQPRFDYGADLFAEAKASVGVEAQLGVGVAEIGNIHLSLNNRFDFSASPGMCSWDLNLGSFSAGGQIGPIGISSPSTPPAYHHNLWHRSCGPHQTVTPTPPSTPLPLVRAAMSWGDDADIDLYAWDEYGNLAYFSEREGIAEAELIEDVIPDEGVYEHPAEYFQETADPNRRYTFGICDYHGEGSTDVTLQVTDPGGGVRTFQHTLYGTGDYEVIATSPDGGGYSPYDEEWCRYRSYE